MMRATLAIAALAGLLAGCASAPPVPPPPRFDAVAAVAAIRAAGTSGDAELVVKPLGSNEVEDLRERATQLQAQGRHEDAASALDQALAISPDDPNLLQERAEAALLLHDLEGAERLARQAISIGTEVGPQCRRHWETIVQVLAARARATTGIASPSPADAEARRQRDACTVAAPPRY
ncbi:tetratricopeptide repeat protein [Lysobacter sp. F6437]|uniref:tetratricopeptide repeat protein n=1 Tax=Lysobacter sp. F6437 TaxID=3459296 RepID=UPI00403D7F2D